MKCEVCTELLEEYLDGELALHDREQVDAHLIACIECSESFATLTAEQELFAHYDREIEVPPFLWTRVAAYTVSEPRAPKRRWFVPSFAAALAVLLITLALGIAYLRSRPKASEPQVASNLTPSTTPTPNPVPQSAQSAVKKHSHKKQGAKVVQTVPDQSDVLSSDVAYLDIDEQDTAKHIEQSKMLL